MQDFSKSSSNILQSMGVGVGRWGGDMGFDRVDIDLTVGSWIKS